MKRRYKILLAVPVLLIALGVAGYHYFESKFFSAPDNRLTVTELGTPFPFEWGSHDTGERIEPHAFQFVPVRLDGLDEQLWMQFDLGTTSTLLYRRQIESLAERGIDVPILDTKTVAWVKDFGFRAGSTTVASSAIRVIEHGKAIDWDDEEERRVIGTLGADWIDGHVLVSDYEALRLQLTDSVPDQFEDLELSPFSFRGRRVFLRSELNGEAGDLWFDSGSSAFQLIVDEGTFHDLAKPGAEEEVYESTSWGEAIHIHNIAANAEARFGATEVPIGTVTYIEWPSQWLGLVLQFSDLGGMCGNKLFLGRTLILDTANERFAVTE